MHAQMYMPILLIRRNSMEMIFYFILFLMGITFGSFYTLAVYRIPQGQDITHTHSYCPKCDRKLGFWDLIPVFSYVFLGGKCRYCHQKIRPRYFLLELLSGVFFLMLATGMKLSLETITYWQMAEFAFFILYFTFIVLMASIDKENRKMSKLVVMYGVIISLMYIVYLCIVEKANIYRYEIYLALYVILLLLDTITLKRKAKNRYVYGVLLSVLTMVVFTGEYVTITAIIITLLSIAIYLLIHQISKIHQKNRQSDKQIASELTVGYLLGLVNSIFFVFVLFVQNYLG